MKITIDTNVDSKEEIQRAINFLLKYIEGGNSTLNNSSQQDNSNSSEGIFNIFSSPSENQEKSEEKKEEPFRINDLIPYD